MSDSGNLFLPHETLAIEPLLSFLKKKHPQSTSVLKLGNHTLTYENAHNIICKYFDILRHHHVYLTDTIDSDPCVILSKIIKEQEREKSLLLLNNKLTEKEKSILQKTDTHTIQDILTLDAHINTLNIILANRRLPDPEASTLGLDTLRLDNLGLTRFPEELIQQLLTYRMLTTLDLGKNKISYLPSSFSKLSQFLKLYLHENTFISVPQALASLRDLTSLGLEGNQLTVLPEFFSNFKNLTKLGLSGNRLNTLPESLKEVKKLTYLSINNNPFTHIPLSCLPLLWETRNEQYYMLNSVQGVMKSSKIKSNPRTSPSRSGIEDIELKDFSSLNRSFSALELTPPSPSPILESIPLVIFSASFHKRKKSTQDKNTDEPLESVMSANSLRR